MTHSLELEFIHFIQQFRTFELDIFFKILDLLDTPKLFFLLVPIVWLIRGGKAGARLFYLLLLSNILNHALKAVFTSPRPFHLDSSVLVMKVPGYGFPSGAAQAVVLLSALLLKSWKSNWKWLVVFSYIFLVSLSRIYLGLYFPSDILAGYLIGLSIWGLYLCSYRWLEKIQPEILFTMSQALMIPAIILQTFTPLIYICSMGIASGLLISSRYDMCLSPPVGYKEWFLRISLSILGVYFCFQWAILISVVYSKAQVFIGTCLLGLWISLIAPFICKILSSQKKCVKD